MSQAISMLELAHLERTVQGEGIAAALRILNQRTVHRFTGVFQFVGDTLHNLHLYDREDPNIEPWPAQPTNHSYCVFVAATGKPFSVASSIDDPRVRDHPKRDVVASYCGVPLHNSNGSQFGSLCHFDYRPFLFSDVDLPFLEAAAPIIMRFLIEEQRRQGLP